MFASCFLLPTSQWGMPDHLLYLSRDRLLFLLWKYTGLYIEIANLVLLLYIRNCTLTQKVAQKMVMLRVQKKLYHRPP